MRRKIFIFVIFIFFIIIGVFRIIQSIQKNKILKEMSKKDTSFVYTVKVKTAEVKNIKDSVNFIGEIKGINEITVMPKVSGRLIKKIKEEGNFVKKDDVICEIDRDEPLLKYTLYELRSPIDGVLAKYFVDVGAMVSLQTPICIISDTQKVRLIFSIADNLVNKITKNSYVKLELENGKTFTSYSLQLSNYIDPVSRSMEIRVILDNNNNIFKSGNFVKGELVFYEKRSLVVPVESVFDIDNKKIIFVLNEENKVEEREVKVGLIYKNFIEVISGVKENEKVVYQGGEILTDGMKVEIVQD